MNANGTSPQTFGFRGDPSQAGAINFAWDAAIQPGTGDVFVANRESNQVEVFSPTGTPGLIFGSNGSGRMASSASRRGSRSPLTARCSSTTPGTTASSGSQ